MNYIFCRTCETFGQLGEGLDFMSEAGYSHAGHNGIVVDCSNPEIEVAGLFVGWLRIQTEYFGGGEHG